MRLGSLFSGAGGLDLAVERVFGADTVWHCERDGAAATVLAHRWPGVPNLRDITEVDWADVEPVDVICGGWPCQPFSLAGKRKGAEDERALWPYVERAVRLVRPRFVVLENVSAVLGPEFQRVANDLAALGYDIAWTCLRASDVGAPHRRERLFAVAYTNEPGLQGSQPAPRRDLPSWRPDANTARLGRVGRSGQDAEPNGRGELQGGGDPERRRDADVDLLQTPSVADSVGGHISRSGTRSHELLLLGQAREMAQSWGKYEVVVRRWEQLTRPAPAPTELTTRNTHRLAPAFSEWLMGWPAGHVTEVPGINRSDQLRICGNGVVPQQATAALSWLLSLEAVA